MPPIATMLASSHRLVGHLLESSTQLLAAEHKRLACLGGRPFSEQVQVAVSLCQQGLVSPHVQPAIVQAAT